MKGNLFSMHNNIVADMLHLTRRKSAGIDNVGSFLLDLLVGLRERRTGKGHETGPGGF